MSRTVQQLREDGRHIFAAGALADGYTVARTRALGLAPETCLRRKASSHFFHALDDLLITGPTGTNVMDMPIRLVG
jgi:hydroxypyruvate reductase